MFLTLLWIILVLDLYLKYKLIKVNRIEVFIINLVQIKCYIIKNNFSLILYKIYKRLCFKYLYDYVFRIIFFFILLFFLQIFFTNLS